MVFYSKPKSFCLFILSFLYVSLVSSQSYLYTNSFPNSLKELIRSELFVFSGVFLVIFAFVYISLSSFFTKTIKGWAPWEPGKKVVEAKGPILIIALVIALFGASSISQNQWIYNFLGGVLAGYVTFIVFIFLILLVIPFFINIKKNLGLPVAIVFLIIFIAAFLLWYFINYV